MRSRRTWITWRAASRSPGGGVAGSDAEFAQRFESEALLWIRLGRHPHIVQARYVLRIGGKPHVFLEYVPGPTGGESTVRRLLRAGRVDVTTALLLAIQTCVGMEHATRIFPGFVHRDLKRRRTCCSLRSTC